MSENKEDYDLKTQYKKGLINLEEFKHKIKEISLKGIKEFNKTKFKSVVLDVEKIKGLN